jgi:hypothetical protein
LEHENRIAKNQEEATLYLYHLEFQIAANGQVFTCKVVGTSQDDAIQDIVNQVGEVRIFNSYHVSEVHRITKTVRRQIMECSLKKDKSNKRIGRPRKYELMGE